MEIMRIPFLKCIIICITYFILPTVCQSQLSNPAIWNTFVSGSENLSIRDTFLLQTFNNASHDNWSYSVSGTTELFDPLSEGISDASDGLSLKLYPGSNFSTSDILTDYHQNVHINIIYAAYQLMKGENLLLSSSRPLNPVDKVLWLEAIDNYTASFRNKKRTKNDTYIQVLGNPKNASLSIQLATNTTKGGFYLLDSVYAFGDIPKYSLFTGNGYWNNENLWSHLPATRNRHALIQGDVHINTNVQCQDIFVGEGNIQISAEASLSVNNLSFCHSGSTLSSSTPININKQITVHKAFPEKGVWYFVSFPFDVYIDGIDSNFQLKDDTPNSGGNFFYLQTYNSSKRALNQQTESNWEVVSETSITNATPIFKKGIGYLIALDENSSLQTISFSSRVQDIPDDFGFKGSIPIQSAGNKQDEHSGWFLCGNPLPAPLPINQLEKNTALDGYIYFYDGAQYKAYSLNSDYAIPPFSAFFVKSSQDTELIVPPIEHQSDYKLLSSVHFSYTDNPEPTSPYQNQTNDTPNSFLAGKNLYLENMASNGKVYILDFKGTVVKTYSFSSGDTTIPLTLKRNSYIVQIKTNHYQAQHKFILAQ